MTHLFDLQVDWIDDIADSAARLAKVRIVTQASSIRTRLTGSRLQRAEPAGVQARWWYYSLRGLPLRRR